MKRANFLIAILLLATVLTGCVPIFEIADIKEYFSAITYTTFEISIENEEGYIESAPRDELSLAQIGEENSDAVPFNSYSSFTFHCLQSTEQSRQLHLVYFSVMATQYCSIILEVEFQGNSVQREVELWPMEAVDVAIDDLEMMWDGADETLTIQVVNKLLLADTPFKLFGFLFA